ncbi:hypothetical protein [Nosocomiicoccus ampullae]|uniref:hypothetical protein n=1 Tax=Nosocomiicoccus ampullae TaxID=489910 RepID=UPI00254CECF1|nr:hypothetical protein [Nosocomiicoccus ampullae]MDK6863191.1 hypothetical protein [Nosocomiicoccus ampullae]
MTYIEKYIIKPFDEATDDEKRLVGPCIFGDNSFVFFQDKEYMMAYLDELGIPHHEEIRRVLKYIISDIQYEDEKPTLEEALSKIKEIRELHSQGYYDLK